MQKVLIEIYENDVRAKFCVHNFNLKYENKELVLKIEKISIKNNIMSTMLIYLMGYEAPNFHEFKKYLDEIKNQYKDSENNDTSLVQIDENKTEGKIKYVFNFDYFLSSSKVLINLVKIGFKSGENIISILLNKIDVQKEHKKISVKLGVISLGLRKDDKNSQNFKIINIDEETNNKSDPKKNLVQARLASTIVNVDLETQKAMQKTMDNYKVQNGFKGIFCRADVGPCFGELGEDIWIKPVNFFVNGGILHKDKDKGRICSFDTEDFELTNGEQRFQIKEIEAFLLVS
jgi:hypothetical protein